MLQIPKLGFTEILGEARFLGEYLRFRGNTMVDRDPHEQPANWRPVLLIPGFMAGDASLYPLGARLRSIGHKVFYAGIWMNADCPRKTLERLKTRIHEVSLQTGRKVVVIGHSLGGVYARELARREPKLIERVILLGSPVKHPTGNTSPYLRPFVAAMKLMHGRCMETGSDPLSSCEFNLPEEPPDVPETVIYTKSDGIVEWHSCIDSGPKVECIEVESSHCGIPLNLKAWQVISARLSYPVEEAYPVSVPVTVRSSARAIRPRTPHRTRPSHLRLVAQKGTAA
jgi:hypothetical protein